MVFVLNFNQYYLAQQSIDSMSNKFTKLIELPFRYKPWLPAHLGIIFDDLTGLSKQPVQADEIHLKATIDWLCRAQDQRLGQKDQGGISAGWRAKARM